MRQKEYKSESFLYMLIFKWLKRFLQGFVCDEALWTSPLFPLFIQTQEMRGKINIWLLDKHAPWKQFIWAEIRRIRRSSGTSHVRQARRLLGTRARDATNMCQKGSFLVIVLCNELMKVRDIIPLPDKLLPLVKGYFNHFVHRTIFPEHLLYGLANWLREMIFKLTEAKLMLVIHVVLCLNISLTTVLEP